MNNRVVSEYVVRLKDDVARGAKSAGSALKNFTREAQALDKIGGYKNSLRGLRPLANEYKRTQQEMKRMSLEMASSGTATAKMKREFDQAARAAQRAKVAYRDQQNAIRSNASALRSAGVNVRSLASEENRLRASIEKTNAAMRKQEAAARRRANRREALGTMAGMAGMYAGHKVRSVGRETVEIGREFDKERRFTKAIMSETDEGMRPLVDQAIHLAAKSRYNDIQVLEGQRTLAARGVKKDGILGMIPKIADYGMAMDLSLPDSAKQIERSLFTFQRDVSTKEKAEAATQKTADLQVKASKISGMTPDDLAHLYNFGAPSAKAAGMKEESLLAMGATLKKAGIGGDQAGVAYRAMIASLTRMTRIGQTSMLANGLNYADYQRVPDKLELAPFVQDIAKTYGIKLNEEAQARLAKVFSDKDTVQDPSKFTPAVKEIMEDELGKQDAKSAKAIASSANRYRESSGKSVDIDRLIYDIMMKSADNPNMLNSIFGSKQGGRLAAALGNPEEFKKMFKEIFEGSDGYSKKIADERNQGFDASIVRMENSWKNALTAIYRSWDNGGEGKGGFLTSITDKAGQLAQRFAELDSKTVAIVSGFGGIAGLAAGGWGTMKLFGMLTGGGASAALTGSATALDGSAVALTRAAVALGAKGGGLGGLGAGAGGTAAGTGMGALGAGAVGTGAAPAAAIGAGYMVAIGAATGGAVYMINSGDEASGKSKEPFYRPMTMGRAFNMMTGGNDDHDGPTKEEWEYASKYNREQMEANQKKWGVDPNRAPVPQEAASTSIARINRDIEAKRALLNEGKITPQAFAKYEKNFQAPLQALNKRAAQEYGPQLPNESFRKGGSGGIDASGMNAGATKAQETGKTMQDALSVTGKPIVDTSSLDQAQAKADRLKSTLTSINGMAAGAGSSVRNVHADTGFGTP